MGDEALYIALRLAKAGWMQGDPSNVLDAPTDIVLNMLRYDGFEDDLHETIRAINDKG